MTHLPFRQTLLILALLSAAAFATAQTSLHSALDSLEQQHLITSWEKSQLLGSEVDLEKRIRLDADKKPERDYTRRDEMLNLLALVKRFSTSGISSMMAFEPAPASSRGVPALAIRAELDSFIRALDVAGFLSSATKEELLQKNKEDKFGWKIQVADFAYLAANEEYFLRPEKLQRFADRLHSEKVISDNNYQLLMQKSARGELHRYSDLPPYMNFCITIPLTELPSDSIGYLRALYAATAKVLPGLQYDSIYFRVKEDKLWSEPDFKSYNLITTIRKQGKTFSYSGFYHADYKDKKDPDIRIPENYHSLFNKLLADLSSPYRLHAFFSGKNTIGIIALTEKQFSQFNGVNDGAASTYMEVSYEKDTPGLTQHAIGSAIKTYDSLGLFSHLSQAEKDSGMAEVNTREMVYYSDILKCFKDLVLDIDAKYGIDSGQYANITSQAALISKGFFNPEKIIDGYSYEHPQFTYGFTLHKKMYSASLHQDGKYLDPKFWDLIEKAVKENDRQGGFHYIYPTDGYTEVYLTNKQFAFLQLHHLLEFTDPDQQIP